MESIEIIDPVPCPIAFYDITPLGEYSRAAFLLCLGSLLNPPSYEAREDLITTSPFDLPIILPFMARASTEEVLNLFRQRDFDIERLSNEANDQVINEFAADILKYVYSSDSEDQRRYSLLLIAVFMHHSNELLRVAAAISWLDTIVDPSRAVKILIEAAMSGYDLVRDMAYTALARVMRGAQALGSIVGFSKKLPPSRASNADSIVVHGTIFSHSGKPIEEWWKPGTGDFHGYLENGPRPNVYAGHDYFRWSGGWSDYARDEGAAKLLMWIDKHNMHGADVFAHSHGCNVSMMASWFRRMGSLILMSSPVHWNLYQPDFSNVNRVLSIRIKWDFVIMADKGGQRFRDPRIGETVLPLWFTAHDESRKSATWHKQNLQKLL